MATATARKPATTKSTKIRAPKKIAPEKIASKPAPPEPADEEFYFVPPPPLLAALSAVWAAYDVAKAAQIDGKLIKKLDDCIHLVLDEIDGLRLDEMDALGLLDREDAIPWEQVQAEMEARWDAAGE